ncbi:MAG TPA: hypothetical protein VMF14_01815 [Solirubrobacteraceae bacterium]|nr:hypothetical protein [Solirubrobacteraceae bacterium]
MPRLATWAAVVAAVVVPVSTALAHSIQSPNLPDGRLQIKGSGYIDVQYNKKTKKFNYVQVYYPCRAAGPSKSKYPAYLSLTTNPRVGLHGGRVSGSFTNKISDETDPKAVGDTASVSWSVRGVRFSSKGLSGTLQLSVTGPGAVCPFSLKNKRLVPLLDIPGNS